MHRVFDLGFAVDVAMHIVAPHRTARNRENPRQLEPFLDTYPFHSMFVTHFPPNQSCIISPHFRSKCLSKRSTDSLEIEPSHLLNRKLFVICEISESVGVENAFLGLMDVQKGKKNLGLIVSLMTHFVGVFGRFSPSGAPHRASRGGKNRKNIRKCVRFGEAV
jgi:hypothetical protein